MTLSESPKVPYSPAEERLFKILSTGRKTTQAICKIYYRNQPPKHARRCVSVGLSSLMRKVKANREPFKIERTPRSGPISMQYWIEKK